MKYLVFLFFFAFSTISAQFSLRGSVVDKENNQPLSGTNIHIQNSNRNTTTNLDGEFFISNIKESSIILEVSFVGYESKSVPIDLNNKENIKISLERSLIEFENVIVKSTKINNSNTVSPFPIEVVENKTQLAKSATTVSDLISDKSGINLMRDGVWGTSVNIRGLSQNNLVYMIDGNRIETANTLSASLSLIEPNDISRIEIIKSGLSSQYGTGATGGLVNIITSSNNYSNSFKITGNNTIGYGSVNNLRSEYLNLNLSNSNWFISLSGSVRKADDTDTPHGKLKNSQFEDNYLSGKLAIRPFENHEIFFNYQNYQAEDVGIPGGAPFPGNASARYPEEKRELISLNYEISNISNFLQKVKTKAYSQKITRFVELKPNQFVTVEPKADHKTFGGTIQVDLIPSENNYLVVGAEYWQRKYEGQRKKDNRIFNKIIFEKPLPDSKFSSLGFFINDEYNLIDNKLKLNLGARYDFINVDNDLSRKIDYLIADGIKITNVPNNKILYDENDVDDNSLSLNLGMNYKINQNLILKFNAAHIFRSPSLEERFQYIELGGNQYWGNPDLSSEKGNSFDLGIVVKNGNSYGELSGFVKKFSDLVSDVRTAPNIYEKRNISNALYYGFDFNLKSNFRKLFSFETNLSFVKAQNTDTDEALPQIPPLNGNMIFSSWFFNSFKTELKMNYSFAQSDAAPNENETKGFVTTDVSISSNEINLFFTKINFYLGVENLLDQTYINHLSTLRGINHYEPGRNFFIKTKIKF